MRENHHAHCGQIFVAADVVGVDVGVDQEADLAVGHLPHRLAQILGHRREQRVDEQDTVRSDEGTDIAAASGPLHHVNIAGHMLDGKLGGTQSHLGPGERAEHASGQHQRG